MRVLHNFLLVLSTCLVLIPIGLRAQHMDHEIGLSFAYSGQLPFTTGSSNSQNFFSSPTIISLRYQAATDHVHALSFTLEHVAERKSYSGLWNDVPNAQQGEYNANISERLYMTTLGLEGIRTLVSTGSLRLGAGFGIAYGLGGAEAETENLSTTQKKSFESCDVWNGLLVSVFARARYSFVTSDMTDLGVTVSVRYWGFPTIGPLSQCRNTYNGPYFRSLHQLGYMLGVSFAFNLPPEQAEEVDVKIESGDVR